MTPEEELEVALAEVERAKAELAAAKAEVADAESGAAPKRPAKKAAAAPKRTRRPMHRTGMPSGCSGTGERFTGTDKVRIDMQPIVMKNVSPFGRPTDYEYEPVECLLVFDVKAGFMDSDSWKRCKCVACAELRRI